MEKILADSASYPDILIHDLERNPELLEFVEGFPGEASAQEASLSDEEREQDFPLFLQWDARWGYQPYGSCVMATGGCGPTALSMVLYHYTRDESLLPGVLGQYAMEHGYYVPGAGTDWAFFSDIAPLHGVSVSRLPGLPGMEDTKDWLEEGGVWICSMRPGDFTDSGHFIVLAGMENGLLQVHDPFSRANSQKRWDYDTVETQCKQAWQLWVP